jgi:hypothetical protein
MDHFLVFRVFKLIADMKLYATAALDVFSADKGTSSLINEDYIIDNRHII